MPAPAPKPQRPMWITIALVIVAGIFYLLRQPGAASNGGASGTGPGPSTAVPSATTKPASTREPTSAPPATARATTDGGIARLFKEQKSDAWVEAAGRVVKVLPDDNETDGGASDRHQRLLVEVDTKVTVLISHNIDVAPRVPVIEGDAIKFRGEYEWTEKGGTVHFTHAPKYGNTKQGGWLEFKGKRYD